ncbi:MAG: ATP-binding domain-containing protein, partial [Clostridia bacterium]|nr:ATP-binding domain-containing protein [Clostridia bacterium]
DFGGEVGLDALSQFLSETSLVSEIDELPDNEGKVVLMTLHSAKGLEFPKVYMAGMEQQLFPGDKVLFSGDSTDLEEERRLCYVGITRAMKKLVLTGAARRMVNGQYTTHLISQFIDEIPAENLKRERSGMMMSYAQYENRREQEDYYSGTGRFGRRSEESFGRRESGFGADPRRSPFPDYENDFGRPAGRFGRDPEEEPLSFGSPKNDLNGKSSFESGKGLHEFFEKAAAGKSAPGGGPGSPAGGKSFPQEILHEFAPGDRVVNRRFGAGTVVKTEQGKNDLLVTVDFDKYGRKVMMAAFAAFTRE